MNGLLLIWLDTSFDEVNDNGWHTIKTQLRDIVGSIHTFTDTDRCIDFLTDIGDEKIFLIISDTYGQNIVPIVHEISQLSSIYIFGGDKSRPEQWTKVKSVFTGTSFPDEALRQIAQDYIKIDEWNIISRLNLDVQLSN